MPYDIIKVKGGYKVAKEDNHKKTFSSYPMSKEMAERQRRAIYMNSDEFRKEHEDLTKLLRSTANVLNKEALAQTKEARMRLGKGVKTRGNRVVRRSGNVMGSGFLGDVFEDLAIDGAKKLYNFDKQHGSHLKEGVKQGFKNMISNVFKGGNGLKEDLDRITKEYRDKYKNSMDDNSHLGWVEKERRDTGYYGKVRPAVMPEGWDKPAILGEGM